MVIGRGAFGKVFLSELKNDKSSPKKLYAIKAIRKDILLRYNHVESTRTEMKIMLNMSHPFLVDMHYVLQNEYRLYFVMPFIQGAELYKLLMKQKTFPEEVVKFYAIQIIIAVGYLHEKGVVHRDLKLENILLNSDGFIKLIDFGLAKTITGKDLAKSKCGTPMYMAPELFDKTGHNKDVDWWALGVLMYEMLVGKTPFFDDEME